MRGLIAATHARRKLAVVHIGTLEAARDAIESGADGLAHLFTDRDPGFGKLVADRHAFVIPTLTVLMSITGKPGVRRLRAIPASSGRLS